MREETNYISPKLGVDVAISREYYSYGRRL